MTDLMQAARVWWFGNAPGPFALPGGEITRAQAHAHGGPSPVFGHCEVCQISEWLSRAVGACMYRPHACAAGTADLCNCRCLAQADESWCNLWQDFRWARGADPDLPGPRLLVLTTDRGDRWLQTQNCDVSNRVFQRFLARACQYDVVGQAPGGADVARVDWGQYDAAFIINAGFAYRIEPEGIPVPILMYGHDCYRQIETRQAVVDRYRPDWFWAPNVANWEARIRFPDGTHMVRRIDAPTAFWTRPNLSDKDVDVLVVGATEEQGPYRPRWELARWAEKVPGISLHTSPGSGAGFADWEGPVSGQTFALAAWSRLLGSARFTMFGETIYRPGWVMRKDWEILSSGAIPIIPDTPDKEDLGIVPWKHFVPLAEVQGHDDALIGLVRDYARLQNIAAEAVAWTESVMDRLVLDGFEDLIQAVTGG